LFIRLTAIDFVIIEDAGCVRRRIELQKLDRIRIEAVGGQLIQELRLMA